MSTSETAKLLATTMRIVGNWDDFEILDVLQRTVLTGQSSLAVLSDLENAYRDPRVVEAEV